MSNLESWKREIEALNGLLAEAEAALNAMGPKITVGVDLYGTHTMLIFLETDNGKWRLCIHQSGKTPQPVQNASTNDRIHAANKLPELMTLLETKIAQNRLDVQRAIRAAERGIEILAQITSEE